MKLNFKEIESTNIDYFLCQSNTNPFNPNEHYRLLTYLARQYNGITIIDAGTHTGLSCLSLVQNEKNSIISYDIVDKNIDFLKPYNNVELKTLDINMEDADIIKSAEIILLDIDPHDGEQEKRFTNLLNEISYEGYVLCDDIHLNGGMRDWWGGITDIEKYDITEIGHGSGTGLLCYNRTATINK